MPALPGAQFTLTPRCFRHDCWSMYAHEWPAASGIFGRKPRTRLAAEEHSPEALACWLDEQSTPPLDIPPECSVESRKLLSELLRSVPNIDEPFHPGLWGTIALLTDAFVLSTGGIFKAAHLYVCEWRKAKRPTTLTPEGLKCFEGFVGKKLYTYALDVATRGGGGSSPSGEDYR